LYQGEYAVNKAEALELALDIEQYRPDLKVVDFTYESPDAYGITIALQDFPGVTITSREEWKHMMEVMEARADIWGEFIARRDA
jgi:hypothetical protein